MILTNIHRRYWLAKQKRPQWFDRPAIKGGKPDDPADLIHDCVNAHAGAKIPDDRNIAGLLLSLIKSRHERTKEPVSAIMLEYGERGMPGMHEQQRAVLLLRWLRKLGFLLPTRTFGKWKVR